MDYKFNMDGSSTLHIETFGRELDFDIDETRFNRAARLHLLIHIFYHAKDKVPNIFETALCAVIKKNALINQIIGIGNVVVKLI